MSEPSLVRYTLSDGIATLTMDDGKANVMSEAMEGALDAALDRAQADDAVVLLTGREKRFSGGYDTGMFQRSQEEVVRTIRAGGQLVARLLGFPRPVLMACNGHAIAQGAFLLLAADVRIGAAGPFKIGLNEVAIGLTIPHYGVEAARFRLNPQWFNHATTTAALYSPEEALRAGFLDQVVDPAELQAAAALEAKRLAGLHGGAHAATKERVRRHVLALIRDGIATDFAGG